MFDNSNNNEPLIHHTIRYLSIRLCDCCMGVYFIFETYDSNEVQNFYLTQDELEHLLFDNFFKTLINNSVFNIDDFTIDFDIIYFFSNYKNQNCMIKIFDFLYNKTVLNNNEY